MADDTQYSPEWLLRALHAALANNPANQFGYRGVKSTPQPNSQYYTDHPDGSESGRQAYEAFWNKYAPDAAVQPTLPAGQDIPLAATGYVQMPGIGGTRFTDALGNVIRQPNPQPPTVGSYVSGLPGGFGTAAHAAIASGKQQIGQGDYLRGLANLVGAPWIGAYGALSGQ
jgi:hypothetical protein